MTTAAQVDILLRAKADLAGAQRVVNQFLNGIAAQAEKEAAKANNALDSIGRGLTSIGRTAAFGAVAGFGALTAATGLFVNMAIKEQANIEKLQAAIRTLSVDQQMLAGSVEKTIRARERLAFSDDAQRDSLALLIAQTGNYDEALKRSRLAMDVARGTGMDYITASRLLGKINEETTNTFARYGIVIRAGATETEALTAIQARFAGQAEAFANTAAGRWEFVKIKFADMAETLGGILLPAVTAVGVALGNFLEQHEAQLQAFTDALAKDLPAAFDKISGALQKALDVAEPFFAIFDSTDAVILASVAVGIITIALGTYVVATVAATFATAGLTLAMSALLLGIPLIIAAIVLLVRHWDEIWPHLKEAPEAILNWLKDHWVDAAIALFVPGGPLILIVKHWEDIWHHMPGPVQSAMNAITSIIEAAVNFITQDLLNPLIRALNAIQVTIPDWVPKLGGKNFGTNIGEISPIDLTLTGGGSGLPNVLQLRANARREAGLSAQPIAPLVGGANVGGGGGGTAGKIDQSILDLRALADAFDRWHAATGKSQEAFQATIEMAKTEADLNRQLADAQSRHNVELVKAGDAGFTLRTALVAISIELLKSGRTVTEFLRDIAQKGVDALRQISGALFGRPTREAAERTRDIHALELRLLEAREAGATEDELTRIQEKIDRLRLEDDIGRKRIDLMQDDLVLADQTLITNAQQRDAAILYTIAMHEQTGVLASLTDQATLEALARSNLTNAMNEAAAATRVAAGASAADANLAYFNSLPPEAQHNLAMLLEYLHSVGQLAGGTAYWHGGPTWVGEQGPEIVNLPRGAQVHNARESAQIAGPRTQTIYIDTVEIHGDPAAGLAALGASY